MSKHTEDKRLVRSAQHRESNLVQNFKIESLNFSPGLEEVNSWRPS